jgi:cell division protein FtsL
MVDSTQILLVVVIVALTILLSVIGVQVFFILREVQRSIQKVNKMLDDAGTISESIAKPITSLSSSITGVSGIAGLLSWLTKRRKKREEEKEK